MAKIDTPWDRDRIYGLKGLLDFYFWKGIPVVRRWPHTPLSHLTKATRSQWSIFGYIMQAWRDTDANVAAAYASLAEGTQRVPRDYQMTLYYNYDVTLDGA